VLVSFNPMVQNNRQQKTTFGAVSDIPRNLATNHAAALELRDLVSDGVIKGTAEELAAKKQDIEHYESDEDESDEENSEDDEDFDNNEENGDEQEIEKPDERSNGNEEHQLINNKRNAQDDEETSGQQGENSTVPNEDSTHMIKKTK
jgi:hypothetical protein